VDESEHREANTRLLAVVVFFLLMFVGFSFAVFHWASEPVKPNEKFWDWLIVVLGSLVSFILGLAAGFFHLNRQNAVAQKKRRAQLRDLLEVELQELKETLGVSDDREQPTNITLTYIQPLILEEAVKSGLFSSCLTKDMLKLAKTYHKYNDRVANLRASGDQKPIEPPTSLIEDTNKVLEKLGGNRNDATHASS
jgi:hypothetical protein